MNSIPHRRLAVIPARGGSKRLPRKNLLPLGGKPLVCLTLEAALKSQCFDTILLSSDDNEILSIGAAYEGITPDERPQHLSGDTIKAREIVWEIMDRPAYQSRFDVVALLLPTAPFRTASDIQGGMALLTADVDSVVSVTNYDLSPTMSVTMDETSQVITPVFNPSPLITGATRSQDQVPMYRPNGGFYISWCESLKHNRVFFKGKVKGYLIPKKRSVDIDDKHDLIYAQFLLDNGVISLEDECKPVLTENKL